MNKEDIDELLTSISYSTDPKVIAAAKEKLIAGRPKNAAMKLAFQKAETEKQIKTEMQFVALTVTITRAEAEQLFKEPRKNESSSTVD